MVSWGLCYEYPFPLPWRQKSQVQAQGLMFLQGGSRSLWPHKAVPEPLTLMWVMDLQEDIEQVDLRWSRLCRLSL